jgi:hypothetical protein
MEAWRKLGLPKRSRHALWGLGFATVNRWENGKAVPLKLAQQQFASFWKPNALTRVWGVGKP